MRKAIATVCLSGTLVEKLDACAKAGFAAVEIFENDLVVSRRSPSEIAGIAADLGLAIDLYQPFRDFEGVSAELFERNMKRAASKFALMNELGADLILLCSNVATASESDDDLAAEQLQALANLATDYGIRIAYEALAWGKHVFDFEHANRIVELVDHPALGNCLDSFHILSRGWDPAPIEQLNPDKIFFCQLADATRLSMDVLSLSRHHRVFPGEGGWDLPAFTAHVARSGYAGTMSLEVFNDVFRQSPPSRTAVDGMRSLIWLEDQTARLISAQSNSLDTAARPSMSLHTLPAAVQPTGINFAEVKAAPPAEMELLLHQLGFEYQGRHRTKPVQLWLQGGARIVLNEGKADGVSPTIAAVGLDVGDAAAAFARGVSLQAIEVPRQQTGDEQRLRAVSSPDGKEVFLCEVEADGTAAWLAEFESSGGDPGSRSVPSSADAGAARTRITGVDHINLSQPWQYFDETILFYESVLSLVAQPSAEVAAPSGLVRSQVIRSDDGAVRLALNIAPLALEGSGPSLAAIYPEHVAFATDNVVEFARQARARGLQFLPVPRNYYADLEARLDVEPSLLEALRELDLLYDRDDDGEFIHFYTRTVGTVFFEVVERRGGYQGYGAPNAQVRLASQYMH